MTEVASNNLVQNNLTTAANLFGGSTPTPSAGWFSTISANQLSVDPKLVNPTGIDFHLSSGSPASGAGIAESGVTVDYSGTPRPNPPSIGAYEYSSTALAVLRQKQAAGEPAADQSVGEAVWQAANPSDPEFRWRQVTVFDPAVLNRGDNASAETAGLSVFFRARKDQPGSGEALVYNRERCDTVSLDLSGLGLQAGDIFEVIDSKNYFGSPIVIGVYDGNPISLAMNLIGSKSAVDGAKSSRRRTPAVFALLVVRKL